MKICFPTMGYRGLKEAVGPVYNRVFYYTIYDTETHEMMFIPGSMAFQHGMKWLSRILSRAGVSLFAVRGMNPDAARMFDAMGIHVYSSAKETVEETLDAVLHRWEIQHRYEPRHERASAITVDA